jgi:PKD repeat protein
MKYVTFSTISILLLLLTFNPFFVKGQQTENLDTKGYQMMLGERPPIDLNNLSPDAYEAGKFKIKLRPGMEKSIPPQTLHAGKDGFVVTGNIALDALNDAFNVKNYRPLFGGLYQTGSRTSAFAERHEAWGFHLWFELEVDEKTDIIAAVKQFATLSEVEIAEPEYRKRLVVDDPFVDFSDPVKLSDADAGSRWAPNDPQYSNQWHYNNTGQQNGTPGADISLQDAWDIVKGNPNVIVAIIDGGIDHVHPDLAGNMWPGIGFNFVTNSSTITAHNHGTHVAGTVAAVTGNNVGVAGVAGGTGNNDGVRLMSCQVFTSNSNGGFHLAPVYAADNGAAISQNSWGYTSPGVYDQSVLNAIDYFNINGGGSALNGGITIFAAGNGNSTGQWYPGYYSGCFSVAGTNNQDKKSWYSNYDSWIDISAPGGETNSVTARGVLSTLNGGNYGYYQGTSMACPHVSGVAALMVSLAYGQLSSGQIADIIRNTTDDHYAVNPSFTGQLGTGRLNAHSALLEVQATMSGVFNPVNFTATAISYEDIELSWSKNPDMDDVLLIWAADGVFGTPVTGKVYASGQFIPGGGVVLYSGGGTSFTHEKLNSATMYHYKAFSYNDLVEYSPGVESQATTLTAPYADFTANPTTAIPGQTITFTDASGAGSFSTWEWDFGDGANPATATGQGPHAVIYGTVGKKTVSLTLDGTISETKEAYITIVETIYSISATYTAGDIPTDKNFTVLPGSSSCPATLVVSIPAGAEIASLDVSYQMTAQNNGWKSEQRSQLRCVNPGGTTETSLASGTGNNSGTQSYSRSGLQIAKDVEGGGDIQFELHAGRTWGGTGCNTTYNKVDNNTWEVTIYYVLINEPVAEFTASPTTIFAGELVDFTDLSTNEPDEWNWTFDGGTPANSTSQHPSVVYETPGVFDVTLTAANAFGSDTETKTALITVEVPPVPVADFSATPTTIFAGEQVDFTDLSTNEPTAWVWSFDGGTPANSTSQHPSVIYQTPGSYNVSLTAANAYGSDTITKTGFITVEALPVPVADFAASATTIIPGEQVDFTDLSTNEPNDWLWNFGGGTPATSFSQHPSVVYETPGTYDVSLIATNVYGSDTITKTGFITVEHINAVVADFTADKTQVSEGEVVHFYDQSWGDPTFWHWEIQGGSPSTSYNQNPVVQFNCSGFYDVKLTVYGLNGQDQITKEGFIEVTGNANGLPPGWEHSATSSQHAIAVPLEANPRIFDVPINPGDFVGVFYYDQDGELKCGGATIWDGDQNVAIAAFGNESFTPFKDGFDLNETFNWRIYSCDLEMEFDATPEYDPATPNQDKFIPMGMSALTDIYAGITYQISVPQGWGGISSPVTPIETGLYELFAAVQDDLTVMYNFEGIFWPGEELNTLGAWNNTGYTIRMDDTISILFAGEYIRDLEHQIDAGTSYLPVLVPCAVEVEPLFAPHISDLFLIRNTTGSKVYWPYFGINTLGSLEPGNAYLIIATAGFEIQFPECETMEAKSSVTLGTVEKPVTPWTVSSPTPFVHTIAVVAPADRILQPGDIIGAFSPDGNCCGVAEYKGRNTAIAVSGKDLSFAGNDGFEQDQPIHFKVYRPRLNTVYDLSPTWDTSMPDKDTFKTWGVSAITRFEIVPSSANHKAFADQVNIYPNPGSGIINISGISQAKQLIVAHTDGRTIATFPNNQEATATLNLTGIPKGIYLLKIIGDKGIRTEKLVLK